LHIVKQIQQQFSQLSKNLCSWRWYVLCKLSKIRH